MIADVIATIITESAPETVKSDVTFTAVNPLVIYGQAIGSVATAMVAGFGVWSSYINKVKIQEVHVLVNSQFQEYKDSVARILALEKEKSRKEGSDNRITQ